jgi:hypothetical protein
MKWLSWLRPPVVRPVLLRLDLRGSLCPATVEVEARWLPEGERVRATLLSSSSMVLLPWRASASEAEVSVRAGAHVGATRVTRESNRDGAVVDVRLARCG